MGAWARPRQSQRGHLRRAGGLGLCSPHPPPRARCDGATAAEPPGAGAGRRRGRARLGALHPLESLLRPRTRAALGPRRGLVGRGTCPLPRVGRMGSECWAGVCASARAAEGWTAALRAREPRGSRGWRRRPRAAGPSGTSERVGVGKVGQGRGGRRPGPELDSGFLEGAGARRARPRSGVGTARGAALGLPAPVQRAQPRRMPGEASAPSTSPGLRPQLGDPCGPGTRTLVICPRSLRESLELEIKDSKYRLRPTASDRACP